MSARVRDVVIVGAGPAGSVTALLLARAGLDVEILERRDFPRAKACGDCISPGANAILQRIGVWNDISATRPGRLRGWLLCADGDAAFSSEFGADTHSLAIERAKLDAILLDAARAAGVSVRTDAHVTDLCRAADGRVIGVNMLLRGTAARIEARLTVGADGLRSRVARRLGARSRMPRLRKLSLTAHVRGVPNPGLNGELHLQRNACLGIAPLEAVSDPLCNVTIVMQANSNGSSTGSTTPNQMMRQALSRFHDRQLSHLIEDDTVILASGPFDSPTRRILFDGAVLVGDAAGYYDPFTGQGIYHALAGAEMLAEHILAARLDRYAQLQRARFDSARRVQRGIEFVCSRPRLARAAFKQLRRSPALAQRLIQITGDMRPARELLWSGR